MILNLTLWKNYYSIDVVQFISSGAAGRRYIKYDVLVLAENVLELVDVLKYLAGAVSNAVEGALRDLDGHAGFLVDKLIEPSQLARRRQPALCRTR